jgi:hypothetical protein
MRQYRIAIAVALLIAGPLPSSTLSHAAGSPPQQLYGKSVTMHWASEYQFQYTDGRSAHVVIQNDAGIYISSAGRIFKQWGRAILSPRYNQVIFQAGGSKSADGSAIKTNNFNFRTVIRFEGHTMTSDVAHNSGASRLTATFNDNFTSCTMSVVHGKESGAPGIVSRSMNNRLVLTSSAATSGGTCRVSNSNVFADQ